MAENPWATGEGASINPWADQKKPMMHPGKIAKKAAEIGFSGLEPDEKSFLIAMFPKSKAAQGGMSLREATGLMDENAKANRGQSASEILFPTTYDVIAKTRAEEAIGQGESAPNRMINSIRAMGGDIFGLPGKGFQAGKNLLGAALIGGIGGETEAARDALESIPGEFADRSDFLGDPALGVGLALPWYGAESVARAAASRGLPALGRAITAYPRVSGAALGAVQGAGQAIGLNAAHELLSPMDDLQPSQTDATGMEGHGVTQAGFPVSRWADPAQMALGSIAGGTLGFLGRELYHGGLMATPGVRDFSEIAARVDRDVLPGLTHLIDQPNTLSKADILRNAERWKAEAKAAVDPIVERTSPLASAERKRLIGGGDEIFFDESGTPFRTMPLERQPYEAEAMLQSGEVPRPYERALAIPSTPGQAQQQLTREDVYKGIVGKAMAEHLAGKGELSKLSQKQIADMAKKMMGTIPEMAPGAMYYPELPRYLAGFNNPAFDLYHSANRDAARELGRLGRKEIAPMYWENPSLDAVDLETMAGARKKFGKAALTDEWIDRANTARIEDRRNLIGKVAGLTEGLRWTGPMAARKLGAALLGLQPIATDISATSARHRK